MTHIHDSFKKRKERYLSLPFQPSELCESCKYSRGEDRDPCKLHENEEEFLKRIPRHIREELESLRRTSRCIFHEYYVKYMHPEAKSSNK